MKTLSHTDQHGEVYNAYFDADCNGWRVDKNGYDSALIPYSASFEMNGNTYMATVISEALRLGMLRIRLDEEAFTAFEKSHPELNP